MTQKSMDKHKNIQLPILSFRKKKSIKKLNIFLLKTTKLIFATSNKISKDLNYDLLSVKKVQKPIFRKL